jgi:hypothetical protein
MVGYLIHLFHSIITLQYLEALFSAGKRSVLQSIHYVSLPITFSNLSQSSIVDLSSISYFSSAYFYLSNYSYFFKQNLFSLSSLFSIKMDEIQNESLLFFSCLRNQQYHKAVVTLNTAVESCRLEWIFSLIFFLIIVHTIARALSTDMPTVGIKDDVSSSNLVDEKQSNSLVSEKADKMLNESTSNTQKMVSCYSRYFVFHFLIVYLRRVQLMHIFPILEHR